MQRYIKAFIINILIFGFFLGASSLWANYSQISINLLKAEFIIFLSFSILLVPTAMKSTKKYYFGSVAFIVFYLFLDGVFLILNRLPTFSDANELIPLLSFMPIYIVSGLVLASIYFALCLWLFTYNKSIKTTLFKLVGFTPACIAMFLMINSSYSEKTKAEDLGRISSILVNEKISKDFFKDLKNYSDINLSINEQFQNDKIVNNRDIHILILESYTDPRLYNISPELKQKITDLVPQMDFDLYTSPTFGGGTSKTEFEVLSGHPSFPHLSTVDFNAMGGGRTNSLVNFLRTNGYNTYATVAAKSSYFNSAVAHKSLGFSKVDYLRERDPYLDDTVMFDGEVLEVSKAKYSKTNGPIFSYTLGMYGHTPHFRDLDKRPVLIEHSDFNFQKLINQFIYRTRAVYDYVEELKAQSPNALLLVIGDHLPPQVFAGIKYTEDIFKNIGFLYIDSKKVSIQDKMGYELHWMILESLTGKKYNLPKRKPDYLDSYFNFIYQSNN